MRAQIGLVAEQFLQGLHPVLLPSQGCGVRIGLAEAAAAGGQRTAFQGIAQDATMPHAAEARWQCSDLFPVAPLLVIIAYDEGYERVAMFGPFFQLHQDQDSARFFWEVEPPCCKLMMCSV
jgi:hypothetical protein